jgi:hypothetical protein
MRGDSTAPDPATHQGGVFTRQQALAAGFSPYRVRRLIERGEWRVVIGSVYAASARAMTPVSLSYAASLAAGLGAAVSHTTAAARDGLLVPADPEVHAIVGRNARVAIPGLRTHRIEVSESELDMVNGVLSTTLPRTILDCLLWLPEEAGRALAVDALRRGRITADGLRSVVASSPQRHGLRRAWSVVSDVVGNAHSDSEVRAHRILRQAGITGWVANAPVHDSAGLVGIVDLLFEDAKLVVELDGEAYHSNAQAFQRDRSRQNRLVALGYRPLRFTWHDLVHEPHRVVAEIRAQIAPAP